MAERRVGLIPSVCVLLEENVAYALYVTDRRMILVRESAPTQGLKDFLNDMFREVRRANPSEVIDFQFASTDALASMDGSKSIPVSSLRSLKFGSLLGNYDVTMEYEGEDGEKRTMTLRLCPLSDLVKTNKAQGIPAKETRRRYALKCQELLRRIVPPVVSSEARWLE